ncbi:chemokine CCL-CUa [Danio rerio]|uniref:Chemokine CCL-CUa n=1 Tax=Danio rerio TaxID=7955 RepID=A0AC58IS06_DANRE|nr:chemokine CCL-C17a [Danio rerio]
MMSICWKLALMMMVVLVTSQKASIFTDATDKYGTNCCKSVSKVEVTDPIIGIRIQRKSHLCVKAIIFETEQGDFCSDPRQPWARRKVQQFLRTLFIKTISTPPPTSSISEM